MLANEAAAAGPPADTVKRQIAAMRRHVDHYLARARAAAASADPALAESGEQWGDLLERHDMNHALALRAEPALVVLVELAASSTGSIAHLRAAVVQQIGRSLADRR